MQFLNGRTKTSALRCTQLQNLYSQQSRSICVMPQSSKLPTFPVIRAPSRPYTSACRAARSAEHCFDSTTPKQSKVAIIAGPTAIGKTAVSLELAKLVNGEVVNADSVQVIVIFSVSRTRMVVVVACLTLIGRIMETRLV
jgi:Cdc6-like AAA superfamily ATPase